MFGELHFQEKQGVLPSPSPAPRTPPRAASWLDAAAEAEKSKDDSPLDALFLRPKPAVAGGVSTVKRSASFCMTTSSASLLLCTEGLGSEGTVDADDMLKDGDAEAAAAAARVEDTAEDEERRGGAGAEEAAASIVPAADTVDRTRREAVRELPIVPEGRPVRAAGGGGKRVLLATREGGRLRLQFASASVAAVATAGRVGVDEELRGEGGSHQAKNAWIDDES